MMPSDIPGGGVVISTPAQHLRLAIVSKNPLFFGDIGGMFGVSWEGAAVRHLSAPFPP